MNLCYTRCVAHMSSRGGEDTATYLHLVQVVKWQVVKWMALSRQSMAAGHWVVDVTSQNVDIQLEGDLVDR
jgi:hypothetical protein